MGKLLGGEGHMGVSGLEEWGLQRALAAAS